MPAWVWLSTTSENRARRGWHLGKYSDVKLKASGDCIIVVTPQVGIGVWKCQSIVHSTRAWFREQDTAQIHRFEHPIWRWSFSQATCTYWPVFCKLVVAYTSSNHSKPAGTGRFLCNWYDQDTVSILTISSYITVSLASVERLFGCSLSRPF